MIYVPRVRRLGFCLAAEIMFVFNIHINGMPTLFRAAEVRFCSFKQMTDGSQLPKHTIRKIRAGSHHPLPSRSTWHFGVILVDDTPAAFVKYSDEAVLLKVSNPNPEGLEFGSNPKGWEFGSRS